MVYPRSMLPTFHDGCLTGLAVSERAAMLSIVRSDGVAWRIELSGVRYLKADDFRQGNIIARFDVVTGVEPSRELIEALVPGPHETAAQEYHDKHRAHLDTLVGQVTSGSLNLVTLTPSYGCEVIVVCEKVAGAEVR